MAGETQFALSIRPPCCDGPSLSQNLKKCCNNTAAQNTARARNTDARISCTTRRAPSTWVSAVTLRIQGEQDARRVRRATNRETPCGRLPRYGATRKQSANMGQDCGGDSSCHVYDTLPVPICVLALCSLSSPMYGCKRTHAQHYIHVKLASKETSRKSHVREAPSWENVSTVVLKTVGAQRTCFLHCFGHCSGTFLSELIHW